MITLEQWRAMTPAARFAHRSHLTEAEREHLLEAIRNEPLPPDYVPTAEGVVPAAWNDVPAEATFTLQPVCGWVLAGLTAAADDLAALELVRVQAGRLDIYDLGFDDPKIALADIARVLDKRPTKDCEGADLHGFRIWPSTGLTVRVRNTGARTQTLTITAPGAELRGPVLPTPPRGGFEFL